MPLTSSTTIVDGSGAGATTPPRATDPSLFINRELSWLEFNQRVLDEAADPSLPLAERLKFLGITASNLDEFFMVRVAGLKSQIEDGVLTTPPDGLSPREQLERVSRRVHRMVAEQHRLWREELRPALEREHGVRLLRPGELSPDEAAEARRHFRERIYPLLTPLANDRSHPFPQLRNKSITLAVHLPRGTAKQRRRGAGGTMAVVGVPTTSVTRLVPVGSGRAFVLVEDLVAEHVADLFFSSAKLRTAAFRVTRNWDLDVDLEEGDDLLAVVSEGVRRRDLGAAVRLEFASDAAREITDPLAQQHGLADADVYAVDGPLQLQDLTALGELARERRERIAVAVPAVPPALQESGTVMEAMAKRDLLLHHPYDSFDPVVRFIEEAADDPRVKAIKQVLYRTGQASPFVKALLRAAEKQKEVAVFLEIRARLDEENNIGPIEDLKRAGAMVVYGYDSCKTHCKVSLVVRDEGGVPRRYVHVGTGNYNPATARLYTDLSLLTARTEIAEEVEAVFHMLTGNTTADLALRGVVPQWPWKRLAVSPHGLKERVLELVAAEASEAAAGKPARVLAKMNSLVDREVIAALYRASQAGVRVDLLVRGICCLRPGVPGVSDRIRVHQVVDRYLEHSRVFAFGEGKRTRCFISSADWMPRNFHSRVEVMAPIDDPALRQRVLDVLEAGLADDVKGSVLRADGRYERLRPAPGKAPLRSQEQLDRGSRDAPELRAIAAPGEAS
ncbi:MAG TPA: polyphosphate kinase 1 [Anaeromyxobacteraceae bacterium]|nr:polyphosphate kinase 1 [Anaeromyxobacteraceae bacterium]